MAIRHKFKELDLDCYINKRAVIWGGKGISLGKFVQIHPYAVLQCTEWDHYIQQGTIQIDDETTIQPFSYIHSLGGSVKIGKKCSINPYCVIYGGRGGLRIGNFVRIATHTVIIPSRHHYEMVNIPITFQGTSSEGIEIQDDVWIGAGVRILDGVEICKGCIIGAGSVITKSTEPFGVYAGNPARRIKDRGV